jgi:hypothetical protein
MVSTELAALVTLVEVTVETYPSKWIVHKQHFRHNASIAGTLAGELYRSVAM